MSDVQQRLVGTSFVTVSRYVHALHSVFAKLMTNPTASFESEKETSALVSATLYAE